MRRISLSFLVLILILTAYSTHFGQIPVIRRNAKISAMAEEISASNIEKSIRKMVEFKTRHTLSSRVEQEKGIGAACLWVKNELEKFTAGSEGRLTVKLDSVMLEPDGRRITRKTLLTNVVASLKGTDSDDKRIFIVGGHLDSRNGETNDTTGFAPGANDDASGVAAVIELARVMSKQKFQSTILFVAFSGEEQGLNGSAFLARKAKEEN
ncbi:MAG: M20/M25/M40 family metallo-hydrolase, partial [Melioribacteraceae bacterium]